MRLLNAKEVAYRLGYSTSWFHKNRITLYHNGLPSPRPGTKRWDPVAVSNWMHEGESNPSSSRNVSASRQALNQL